MVFLIHWLLLIHWAFSGIENPEVHPVRFEITNAGITVDGHFGEFSHTIRFDPDNLKESVLEGRVVVSTLDTGIGLRDRHLQGRQYFRSDSYPEIVMKSKKLTRQGTHRYLGVFEIRIKDIVKEMAVPFRIEKQGAENHYRARFILNRLDFGLGEESLVLANDVTVVLDVPATSN